MHKSVDATQHEFGSVRTGRASPALLDRVVVDYYGAPTPLKQLATIYAPEARLLTVQPYDKSSIKAIEKAIMESDIGLTPNNDGKLIRLAIPELNEERRKELVKVVRHIAEEGRVAIRNVRRDVMHDLRELKDGGRGRRRRGAPRREVELQKLTDARDRGARRAAEGQGSRDPGGLMVGRRGRGRRGTSPSSPTATAAGRAQRGLPSIEGHQAGADTVKARLRDAAELGVKELTVYSFSTENWSRPAEEVTALMRMFSERIDARDAGAARRGRADALHRAPRAGLARRCWSRWTGPRS